MLHETIASKKRLIVQATANPEVSIPDSCSPETPATIQQQCPNLKPAHDLLMVRIFGLGGRHTQGSGSTSSSLGQTGSFMKPQALCSKFEVYKAFKPNANLDGF